MIVVWRVTERCNLGCGFCAYDRAVTRRRRDALPEAILAFGCVLGRYQQVTHDPVLVSWLGGEPLLWRPLGALTTAFTALGLRVSTTTNGTTLGSSRMRAHLLEHYAELTISIDGFAAVHDRLRAWPGGFARLRQGVRQLADAKRRGGSGPRLRANVVLMRDNVAEFPALCAELVSWGIEEVTFNQLGGNDRPAFHAVHRLLPDQVEQLAGELPPLRAAMASAGAQLRGGSRYVERIRATATGRRIPVVDCDPGASFLFISEDGIVAPCSFTVADYGVPIASIASVADLRALRARFAESRAHTRLPVCDDCPSTHVFAKFGGDADDP